VHEKEKTQRPKKKEKKDLKKGKKEEVERRACAMINGGEGDQLYSERGGTSVQGQNVFAPIEEKNKKKQRNEDAA